MTAQSPTLADVVRVGIAAEMLELNVCMPGIITVYDPAKRIASVQPSLNRKFREQPLAVPLPLIPNVPVMFPSGTAGTFSITWPLVAGDSCILIFSQRSLDKWIDQGAAGPLDTGDDRRHALIDAICYPGAAPTTVPVLTKAGTMVFNAPFVEVGPGAAAAGFVSLANKTAAELATLVTAFNAHTHLTVTAPIGPAAPTAPPIPTQSPPTPASLGSIKLKSE